MSALGAVLPRRWGAFLGSQGRTRDSLFLLGAWAFIHQDHNRCFSVFLASGFCGAIDRKRLKTLAGNA